MMTILELSKKKKNKKNSKQKQNTKTRRMCYSIICKQPTPLARCRWDLAKKRPCRVPDRDINTTQCLLTPILFSSFSSWGKFILQVQTAFLELIFKTNTHQLHNWSPEATFGVWNWKWQWRNGWTGRGGDKTKRVGKRMVGNEKREGKKEWRGYGRVEGGDEDGGQ